MRRIFHSVAQRALAPTGGGEGDEFFNNVVLLLDWAGSDGATDTTDLSNSAHVDTFLEVNTAEIDTAQQTLGVNSLLVTPASGVVTTGGSANGVTFPASADWRFGTGDFTVEVSMRFATTSVRQNFVGAWEIAGGDDGWAFQWNTGNNLAWWRGDTGSSSTIVNEAWSPVTNTWYHLAAVRASGTTHVFVDGTELGTGGTDSTDYQTTNGLAIGHLNHTSVRLPASGNIGAVRITKGVARYTGNFTAPTVFYPTS